MEQLLAHLIGDFALQNSWMANNKTKNWYAALVHCLVYFIPFLFFFGGIMTAKAALVIIGTHFIIDRFNLATLFIFFRENLNYTVPYRLASSESGFPEGTPIWLAKTLNIIIDNTAHLTINYLAIKHLC